MADSPASRKAEPYLVLRAQAGDRDALDQLLTSLQLPLYRYLLRLLSERPVSEDVLQDTLIQICKKIGLLKEPLYFRAWSYRIASRLAYKQIRKRTPTEELREADACPAYESSEDQTADIEKYLSRLTPACRAVVSLHFLEGLSLDETSAALEIPLGTVKSRLNYGLTRLRQIARGETLT